MKPHEIKDLRKQKKLTQAELGEVCGVTKASVSRWENGKDNPSGGALKILHQLRDGILIPTRLTDLEQKLLEQNVEYGGFKDAEDYLTKSLKHLLMHGEFMSLTEPNKQSPPSVTSFPQSSMKTVHTMAAAGSEVEAEIIDWDEGARELNVRITGDSMAPLFNDDDVISMAPRSLAKGSQIMAKGKFYLIREAGGLKLKRYNTRPARPDEAGADYLTPRGTVGILESVNPAYPATDIVDTDVDWIAWLEKDGSYPKDV